MKQELEQVLETKIIAIVREIESNHLLKLVHALYEGGIDRVEVTFNQAMPDSWKTTAEAIKELSARMKGLVIVGAGTVINKQQLEMAAEAGARYIIMPNTNQELIANVKAMKLLAFPGAFTPSEIVTAYEAGADAVKIFPAGGLGANYIKAVKAPLSHIRLIAVGGVNETNAAEFIAAGCVGVGVGGNLVNKKWIQGGEWDQITALARMYRKAVDGK